MSLNPNAAPWTVPETTMDPTMDAPARVGHHDHRFHHVYGTFYPPQHPHTHPHGHPHSHAMSQVMMNQHLFRHMPQHGGYHNINQMSQLPHSEPVQSYNNTRIRPQQYNSVAANQVSSTMIKSYKQIRPFVIVVFGYRRTGKTSVAKRISEMRNYKYISLKPRDENITLSPTAFVAPLVDILSRKNTFEGIVIDDIVLRNKYEPYYVHSVLQKHGLKIDVAVFLDNDLENASGRGIDYEDSLQRQHHPESYEFCASYLQGEPIVVIETRERTLEDTIACAVSQIGGVHNIKETTLSLEKVELMPQCPLECNPVLVTAIINAQHCNLNLRERASFPFSEANYLLEYSTFARHAYAFRHYMITPWIQGDKVSLIGYRDAVYIYLPTYNIVFSYTNAPQTLVQLAKEDVDDNKIGFIFEATFSNGKLYISELLSLGDKKGSRMLVEERVDLVKEKLKDMNDDTVRLLPWYQVSEIETCESENPEASGVLFVNPDGVMFGEYNSRNFLYPLQRKKSVEVRIWNGSFNADLWTFDAYCLDMEKEVLIEGVPVHISDADVTEHCINDGNILECTREDYPAGTTNKAKKGAKHFVFQRRCNWMLKPTTLYKQEFFLSEPKWPLERMALACAFIKHVPAVRQEETTTADG